MTRRTASETNALRERAAELAWKINHVEGMAPSVVDERTGRSSMAPAHRMLLTELQTDLAYVKSQLAPAKRGR